MKGQTELLHDVTAVAVYSQKLYERIHDIYLSVVNDYTPDIAWRRVYEALGVDRRSAKDVADATENLIFDLDMAGVEPSFNIDEVWPKFAMDYLAGMPGQDVLALKRLVKHIDKSTKLIHRHGQDTVDPLDGEEN